MSKRTTTKTASTAATASAAPQALPHPAQPHHGPVGALHQPFEWLSARDVAPMLPAAGVLALVNRSLDVANGVSTTLRMLEQIQIDDGCEDDEGNPCPPLLDDNDAGHLLRLAMAASDMLGNDIARFQDFARGYSEAYRQALQNSGRPAAPASPGPDKQAGSGEDAAMLRQVRAWLEKYGDALFTWTHRAKDDPLTDTDLRAGFKRMQGGLVEFLVLHDGFHDGACKGFDPEAVAALLSKRGHLKHEAGTLMKKVRVPGVGLLPCYCIQPSIFSDELAAPVSPLHH